MLANITIDINNKEIPEETVLCPGFHHVCAVCI